jgi:hypothetical protein
MQAVLAETVAVKATTPLQITIVPESSVSPGSIASFVVRVSSSLASNNLVVAVSQPAGSELMSGELNWSGGIAQGEVRELRFMLRLPADSVPSITATATILSTQGGQLAASDVYRQAVATPTGLKAAPGRTVSRQGRAVVEYSLK